MRFRGETDFVTEPHRSAAEREVYPPLAVPKATRAVPRPYRLTLKAVWFDGGLMPPRPPEVPAAEWKLQPGGGTIIYGDKGTLLVGPASNSPRLLPESRMQELRASLPPKTISRVKGGPHLEWVNAIRGGPACGSQFDYSAPLTELVLIGVAAIRAQSRLD